MLPWHQAEHHRNRRLTGALGLSLVFHAALALLPFSPFSAPGGSTPGALAGNAGRASRFLSGALQGAEIEVSTPPPPATAPVPPPSEPEPEDIPQPELNLEPPRAPEPLPVGPQAPLAGTEGGTEEGTALPAGEPGSHGLGPGDGPPAPPAEVAIKPRIYAYPRVPEEIVRKRKIDDFVLLQVLVGPTGQVRDVRVLRAIANCPECTESAVESARRSVYEPYVLRGRAVEVWSLPFPLHFSYRR